MNLNVDLKNGVYPVSEFRKEISSMIKQIRESHRPTLLTEYGKSSAVVIGAEDYQNLVDKIEFYESFIQGIEDLDAGRKHSTEEARKIVMEGLE